jgi:hypothetical protein
MSGSSLSPSGDPPWWKRLLSAPQASMQLHRWCRYRMVEEAQARFDDIEFSGTDRLGYSIGWLGGLALRSCEIAVTICAGAKGFASRTLLGTPLDAHSSP